MRIPSVLAAFVCSVLLCACEPVKQEPSEADRMRDEIKALMNQNPPAGNVRIEVERLETEDWRRTALPFAVGNTRGDAFSISRLSPAWSASRKSATSRETSFLVLMPGSVGEIQLVQHVREPWIAVIPVWRGHVIVGEIREEVLGSSLQVAVGHVDEHSVEVQLMPYYHGAKRRGPVEVQEVRTTVRLKPGEPTLISAYDSAGATADLFRSRNQQGSRQIALVLTATVGK